MAKTLAYLEYCFLFDPNETWSNVYDFERELTNFFGTKGYQAEVLDAPRGYTGGHRMVQITKRDTLDALATPNQPQVGIQKTIANITSGSTQKGRPSGHNKK